MNFENFWERFTSLEHKHNLLSIQIDGLQLYALRRVKVFYALLISLGLYSPPHPGKTTKKVKNNQKPRLDPVDINFAEVEESPVVVIPFRRLVGGIDPYSQTITENLRMMGQSPKVLDWSWISSVRHEAILQAASSLMGKIIRKLSSLMGKIIRKLVKKSVGSKWSKVVRLFELEFSVSLNDLEVPKSFLMGLNADVAVFTRYFRQAKVKDIYLVDAYSEPWVVMAGHAAGVRVHEIQHGFINEFHPGYSYPHGSPKLDHTPDELLVWGEFWTQSIALPNGMTSKVSGATRQLNDARKKATATRNAKQILFTSQGAVSRDLQKVAISTAQALSEFKIIYRLHPNEDLSKYPQIGLPNNFSYSHKTPILIDLLLESNYLVGVFSTTLYEGIALGAKVLVLPLPGFENMKRAITNGDVTLISDLGRIDELIQTAKASPNSDIYYARENSL